MPKVINTSDKPYGFTFDSGHYGPIAPGEVVELAADVAAHAVRRSEIIDPDFGDTLGYALSYLDSLPAEKIKAMAMYECPLVQSNQCKSALFKTVDDLRAHLETEHWGQPKEAVKSAAQIAPRK